MIPACSSARSNSSKPASPSTSEICRPSPLHCPCLCATSSAAAMTASNEPAFGRRRQPFTAAYDANNRRDSRQDEDGTPERSSRRTVQPLNRQSSMQPTCDAPPHRSAQLYSGPPSEALAASGGTAAQNSAATMATTEKALFMKPSRVTGCSVPLFSSPRVKEV